MNIKEFYKFTWTKLILLFLIVMIPLFFIMQQMGISDGPPINFFWIILTSILFWPFMLVYYLESLVIPNIDWIHAIDIPFVIIAVIINMWYIYSIASLITYLFGKTKTK